jgi:hypothetical protein
MAPRRGGKHPPPSHERGGFAAPLAYPKTCLPNRKNRGYNPHALKGACFALQPQPVRASCAPVRAPLRRSRAVLSGEHSCWQGWLQAAPLRGNGPVTPSGAEGLEPPTYGFGDRRSTN